MISNEAKDFNCPFDQFDTLNAFWLQYSKANDKMNEEKKTCSGFNEYSEYNVADTMIT